MPLPTLPVPASPPPNSCTYSPFLFPNPLNALVVEPDDKLADPLVPRLKPADTWVWTNRVKGPDPLAPRLKLKHGGVDRVGFRFRV